MLYNFYFSGSNTNSNAPLILPPGMSIEQKTEFLSNLDPKHQFFISMPHTNAGMGAVALANTFQSVTHFRNSSSASEGTTGAVSAVGEQD